MKWLKRKQVEKTTLIPTVDKISELEEKIRELSRKLDESHQKNESLRPREVVRVPGVTYYGIPGFYVDAELLEETPYGWHCIVGRNVKFFYNSEIKVQEAKPLSEVSE